MRTWMMFLLVVVGLIVHTNVAAVAHAYSGPQSDAVFQARPLISELTVTGERNEADTVTFDEIGVPVQILNPEKDELYAVGTVVGGVSQGARIARISIVSCTEETADDPTIRLVCLALSVLTEAGTYTGAVDITNNSNAGDSIAVTTIVPDADTPTATMISGDLVAQAQHTPFWPESALQPIDVYVRTTDESTLFPVGAVVGSIGGPGPTIRVTRAECLSPSPVASAAATQTALPTQDQENPTQPAEETLAPEPSEADTPPAAQTDDVKRVCLSAQGLSNVGTYTGPVDVTDNDTDDHVSLSITVADRLFWAILAAIGGVLLYSLIGWAYNYVASSALSYRANLLEKHINDLNAPPEVEEESAAAKRQNRDPRTTEALRYLLYRVHPTQQAAEHRVLHPQPNHPYTLDAKLHFDTFWEQFNAYRKSLVWDTSGEEHKALVTTLDTVDADYKLFRDQLNPELANLEESLQAFRTYLRTNPVDIGADKVPPLVEPINKQGSGVALPVGSVQPRLDLWQDQQLLMQTWMDAAARIQQYRRWIEVLLSSSLALTDNERNSLKYGKDQLCQASYELYDVKDVAHLERLRVRHELEAVYKNLASLGGKYNIWQPRQEPQDAIQALRVQPPEKLDAFQAILGALFSPRGVSPEIIRWTRNILTRGLILIAILLAVLAGLQTVYFAEDHAFGTLSDYISLLILGSGIQGILAGLPQIGRFFSVSRGA